MSLSTPMCWQARAKGGYEGDLDMDAELQRLDRRQNAALAVRGDRMGPGASVALLWTVVLHVIDAPVVNTG